MYRVPQVHRSGRVFAADTSSAEHAAGAGGELHLRKRPHHFEHELIAGAGAVAVQKPPRQVRHFCRLRRGGMRLGFVVRVTW